MKNVVSLCAVLLFTLASKEVVVSAFSSQHRAPATAVTALSMAPRYDRRDEKWIPSNEKEGTEAYGPIGSLIRGGPLPFIQRIINADNYEQAVYKYMANEGVDRKEAQGNVDAYFENPNDWALQKLVEKNGGPARDYANLNTSPKQLVLSAAWASVVVYFFTTLIIDSMNGVYAEPTGYTLLHGKLFDLPF